MVENEPRRWTRWMPASNGIILGGDTEFTRERQAEQEAEKQRRLAALERYFEQYGNLGTSGTIAAINEGQRLLDEGVPLPPSAAPVVEPPCTSCGSRPRSKSARDGLCVGCRNRLYENKKRKGHECSGCGYRTTTKSPYWTILDSGEMLCCKCAQPANAMRG